MEYIKVFIIDLPETIHGLTTYYWDSGECYYTIFINAKMSSNIQCAAYDHEIQHIDNGDFDKMIPVDELENYAHAV